MIQTEAEEMFTLEKIFQEWIDYLIDIGKVKRESVNWKLLQEAIVAELPTDKWSFITILFST